MSEQEFDSKYKEYVINSLYKPELESKETTFPFNFGYIVGEPKSTYRDLSQRIVPKDSKYDLYESPYEKTINAPFKSMLVGGVLSVNCNKFYKMIYNGKAFFMRERDVILTQDDLLKLDSLESCTQDVQDIFFNRSLRLSNALFQLTIQEANKYLEKYANKGLAIEEWSVYDESPYTSGTGVRMKFLNPTNKTIQYITVSFQGYNAVDDPYAAPLTKRGIGPISPGDWATYTFEYVWMTDVVEYAKIKSIKIIYTRWQH
ncbi:MAG: hypothetical protein K2L21_06570 [Muribaculaceae bacterium]|nr:hypothetical protein [Muribaculaceae bacterium]